jgi:tetratricopeptide (TPR) repeat protein
MKSAYGWLLCCFVAFSTATQAQVPYLNSLPNGPNKKAMVYERVGLAEITVKYFRPAVNGREGAIWGKVVHTGFVNQGFGVNKPAPWRAGANDNTIFETSHDILVEGKPLPKGKYGFFIAYEPQSCTVVFSKKSDGWGSYFYDDADDVLRVTVVPKTVTQSVEWLRYNFYNETENSATLVLEWEKLQIPIKIETNYVKDQFEAISAELRMPSGFTWESLTNAANWCLTRNYELPQALKWAKLSSDPNSWGGDKSFTAISTTARILEALGKNDEAAAEMKRAIPYGTVNEVHQYAKQLLAAKKTTEALSVFEMNHKNFPNQFTTMVGMIRGLSATGQFKKALGFAEKALPIAPDPQNKASIAKMIEDLKNGKDVNAG